MLDIMNKRYGLFARYYEKKIRVCHARYYKYNVRVYRYALYYEKMLEFVKLDIMNKCYGSVCSVL